MGRGEKELELVDQMGRENSVNQRKPIRVPISDLERAIRCVQNRFFRFPLYPRPVRAGQPAEVESGLRTRDSSDRFFHKDFVVKYLRPILAHSVRITAYPRQVLSNCFTINCLYFLKKIHIYNLNIEINSQLV